MATTFLSDNELNHELEQLFHTAEKRLILISPYISLHPRYASVLKAQSQNDKLEISIVFGKNEDDPSRSMKIEDVEFFMQFPNVEVKYEPRLHAKYYANDFSAIITSMNLYRYSQDHNIEAGIKLDSRTGADRAAFDRFDRVIEQGVTIFRKEPRYEKANFGLTQRYSRSEVVEDRVAEYFRDQRSFKKTDQPKTGRATPQSPSTRSSATPATSNGSGFCIRTGSAIPFNVKKPFSDGAFANWGRYKDENYKEKFCHFSGESSNGDTCFAKPILRKNWTKAKATFNF